MKNIILAAALALGSVSVTIPQAVSATVTITNNGVRVHQRDHRRHHGPRCTTKTVRTYRNHKLIIKKVRVCR